MVAAVNAGCGRAARALRVLLLLAMALTAVEYYLSSSYLKTSPLKTYIYAYNSNMTISTLKFKESSSQTLSSTSKRLLEAVDTSTIPSINTAATQSSSIGLISKLITDANLVRVTKSMKVDDKTEVENIEITTKKFVVEKMKVTSTLKSQVSSNSTMVPEFMTERTTLPLCPAEPPDLGPVRVKKWNMRLSYVEKKFPEVQLGGHYRPPNCAARHKVAIIVPYRNRQQHLAIFLNHIHPFLMKQQIEYGLFIVEQNGRREFNRAKLFNVGVKESYRSMVGGWQCFIFHDVDLLPLDTRNMYTCPEQPRHMSPAVDTLKFELMKEDLFGGVSAMTAEQFNKVNGFSNKYWGWGGEDDDMAVRLKENHYNITRYKMSIARYIMLAHKKANANPKRYSMLEEAHKNYKTDGLNSLRYRLVHLVEHHLYTLITANIDEVS